MVFLKIAKLNHLNILFGGKTLSLKTIPPLKHAQSQFSAERRWNAYFKCSYNKMLCKKLKTVIDIQEVLNKPELLPSGFVDII